MLLRYIIDLFVLCNNVSCLRGTNKLFVPRKKTSTLGLKSTTFIGAKVWNSLPNELRSTTILKDRIYGCCEKTKFLMYSFFMVNCNSLKFEIFLILFFDIARMLVIN